MTNGNGRDGSNSHFGNSWKGDINEFATTPLSALNDPVVITSGPQDGSVTEITDRTHGENRRTLSTSGVIGFTDADSHDSHTFSITPNGAGYIGALTAVIQDDDDHGYGYGRGHRGGHSFEHRHDEDRGRHGDHDHGSNNGSVHWTFSVKDSVLDYLAAGETLTQTYTITIDDGHGGAATQLVTITLHGTNDAPVITSAVKMGSVTELPDGSAGENTAVLTSNGTIDFTDVDLSDSHVVSVTPVGSGYRGALSVSITDASTGDGSGTVSWTYTVNDAALDDLNAGDQLVEKFIIAIDDGHGGVASKTVLIKLNGADDATGGVNHDPVITSSAQVGLVFEIIDGASGENLTIHTQSGAIMFTDQDIADVHTATVGNVPASYLGDFVLAPVDESTGTVAWSFSVNDADLDSLAEGQVLTQTYDVTIDDGAGGTATETVTVTIAGTNDVPVISGINSGTVFEDSDPATLSTSGALTIADPDQNESSFDPQASAAGTYGDFTLDAAGNWTYTADNAQAAIQQLGASDTLTDSFVAVSSDGTASETVTVAIQGVNDAPTAISLDNTSVNENDAGAVIGVVSVTDQDPGETFTYQVDDDRFEIANGNLKLKDGVALDFEQEPTVNIAISATDSGGLSVSQVVVIGVNDGAEGNAIDGYIAGATVFADANNNGVLDAGEVSTTTDADGNFTLFGGTGPLVMQGGTDISTGLAFTGVMRAPEGSTVVTPLTTLVAAIAGAGATSQQIADANAAVLQGLGLDSSIDLSSFDPIQATVSSDPTLQTQGQAAVAAAVQIQNTIVQASSLLSGAGATDATSAVITELANQVSTQAQSSQTLNLNDASVLTSIITTAGTASGANSTSVAATASGAANVISASNQVITDAASQTGTDLLTTLAQVSVVAQGAASTSLADAGLQGTTAAISDVETNYTGTNLTDAVSTATVGDVLGANAPVTLTGTSGADVLQGSTGNDTLSGLAGNDLLQGFDGNDVLDGGANIDKAVYADATGAITVNMAAGTVSGAGVGTDTLLSVELIKGSNFADTYDATGFGATSANAGSNGGFNEFEGRGGDDVITGNGSTRVSYLSATSGVTVNLGTGTGTGDASVGTDTFTGVNAARGSNYNDTLLGSNATDQFEGRGGSDFINGMGGSDRARYDFETAAVQVNMASGIVTGGDAGGGYDTLRSIELVRGTNFGDVYDATGFTASSPNAGSGGVDGTGAAFNEFEGMGGNDIITGNGNTRIAFYNATGGVTVDLAAGTVAGDASVGNDTITGGVTQIVGSQFDDTLQGFDNPFGVANVFDGRAGNDTFDGRGGYDQAIYNTTPTSTGIAVDMAAGTVTGDSAIGTDTLISIESVRGTNFADTFVATGYNGASADLPLGTDFNEFEGMGGDDVITGNGNTRISYLNAGAGVTVDLAAGTASGATTGNDTFTGVSRVRGSNLADTISGDGNANVIEGRNGNDVLDGRGGNDMLTGGANADTFVYATGGGADTFTDFNSGEGDTIDVTGVSGVSDLAGILAFATQNGSDTIFDFGGGDTLTLTGVTLGNLTAGAFIFGAPANQAPTDISLSNASVAENSANGTVVGSLSAVDPDAGDSASFTLLNDAGGLFALNGSDVVVAGALDYETATSHDITVRVTDGGGLTYDKVLTIGVSNVNEVPTDIALSNASVAENSVNGTVVGNLSAADPDAGDSASFTLLNDAGGLFALNGSDVVVAGALDYETAASHDITVRVTDGGGLTYDKVLTINVTDVAGLNVVGDAADNNLLGSPENDTLQGLGGNDVLQGLGGDDTLDGGIGLDRAIYADATGPITVDMTAGTVSGNGVGNDTLVSVESIRASNFADTYVATGFVGSSTIGSVPVTFNEFEGMGGDDDITGNGNTRLSYLNATSGVTVDLLAGTATGDASVGNDTFTGVSSAHGSNFADTLLGSNNTSGVEIFAGGGGDDFIDGRGGFDRATYTFHLDNDATGGVTVNLAAGTATGAGVGTDTLRSIESVRGTNFDDVYDATGFSQSSTNTGSNGTFNEFEGMGGDDLITGNGNTRLTFLNATGGVTVDLATGTVAGDASVGNDTITGGVTQIIGSQFDDTLQGFDNPFGVANVFDGRGGNDTFDGRGGYDQAVYDNTPTSTGIVVDMAAGTVTGDSAIGTDTLISIESVRGTNFADTYDATGYTGASADLPLGADFSEFEGMGGDDIITGNGNTRISYLNAGAGVTVDLAVGTASGATTGNDTFTGVSRVRGSNLDDTISGDSNNNVIEGRNGNDVLDGRGGNDTLTGGGNGDTFVYAAGYGADTVADFNQGEGDKVDLTGVAAVTDLAGVLALATQNGADTVIDFGGGDTLTLSNFTLANLTAGDFLFATPSVITGDVNDNTNLVGTPGIDTIQGLAGDDLLQGLDGDDTLDGGDGRDFASYVEATGGLTIDLGAGTVTGAGVGSDTLLSIENILGSDFADTYDASTFSTGSPNAGSFNNFNVFEGRGGDDVVTGNGSTALSFRSATGAVSVDMLAGTAAGDASVGNDTFTGVQTVIGSGYDDTLLGDNNSNSLRGLAGNDFINGRGGFDTAQYSSAVAWLDTATAGVTVNLAVGTVTGDASVGTDTLRSIEAIRGTNLADAYDATGFSSSSTNAGSSGTFNEIEGMGGDDTITGNGNTRVSYLNAAAGVTVDLAAGTGQGTAAGDAANVGSDVFTGVGSVRGSKFDDTLSGSNNAANTVEQFEGRDGNDVIDGRGGFDRASYQFESAAITVNLAAGTVSGGDGNDTLLSIESVRGTNFADVYDATGFNGTSTNAGSNGTLNEFEGLGGNDSITGNGNTRISFANATAAVTVDLAAGTASGDASVGNDTFTGVSRARGSNFGDTISGDGNNNVLEGQNGNDVLQGFGGNDTLNGGGDFDRAVYTDATGSLSVDMAAGTVSGAGVGSDTLISIESVQGGDFADTFIATGFNSGSNGTFNEFEGMGGDDIVTGNGNTRVSYVHAAAAVTVDLAAGTGQGTDAGDLAGVGSDTFTAGVGSVRGSNFDDTIYGSNIGFQQFEGRGGSDLIDGRGGLDRARYDFESSGIQVDLAAGTVAGGDAGGGQDTLQSVELIRGTNFGDTYDATGFGSGSTNAGSNGTFNEFEGLGGNDIITGNGNTQIVFYNATGGVTVDLAAGTVTGDASVGSDTITGGVTSVVGSQFDDVLQGFDNPFGVGNVFEGRAGNDTFDGRGGYDQAVYNNDSAVTTGINVDMAAGTITGDSAIGTDTLISIESVRGTNFADTYDATGYTGASADLPLGADFNEFEGMGGDDVITGNGNTRISYLNAGAGVTVDLAAGTASGATTGNDTFTGVSRVRGSNLNDTISGDSNNNVLEGRNGNDVINGGAGDDSLTGGADADTFVFGSGFGHDVVIDFAPGTDLLELSSTIFADATSALAATADDGLGNTVITVDANNSITLDGILKAQLSTTDFHIV